MNDLNYHHFRLFWAVAREGHLTRASARLHLTPQTVSMQVSAFEVAIGEKLFHRSGRRLLLTDAGRVALQYADEIFALGQEFRDVLRGGPTRRPYRLSVGVADVLPKIIAHQLIEPALRLEDPVRIICREGSPEKLLAELAVYDLDVVLSDGPIPPSAKIRGFNHKLGTCGAVFMARADLATRLREEFPASLDGQPVLLPCENTILRREVEEWFDTHGVVPVVAGEFDDSALLKAFGGKGVGFFSVPTVIGDDVARQYNVEPIGTAEGLIESFYAISLERRVQHPATAAICTAARSELFAGDSKAS